MKDVAHLPPEKLVKLIWSYFDKPERLEAFDKLSACLPDPLYWATLRQIYEHNESLYLEDERLRRLFNAGRSDDERLKNAFNRPELETYRKLPDRFSVWRGCWSENMRGWSWTTDHVVAERYAARCPYDGQPLVALGRVDRANVRLLLENDSEIVADPNDVDVVDVEKLKPTPVKRGQVIYQQVQAGLYFDEATDLWKHRTMGFLASRRASPELRQVAEDRLEIYEQLGFERLAKLTKAWLEQYDLGVAP